MFLLAALLAASAPPAEETAIFKAAGFKKVGAVWKSGNCDGAESESYAAGSIETYKDINGDGRPDAIVIETGAVCYGMAGQRFWLVSKQQNGSWKTLISEIGIPEFYSNKGRGGWPDLSIGGPGLCFPIYRWAGRQFEVYTFEYEGKRCKPPEGAN